MQARIVSWMSRPSLRCYYATVPTTPSAPPLLLKIRADMKTAMKEKDTNRLNVLRALIAETANAAKTSSPIKTNIQLLSLLRKRAAASKAASQEFSAANRNDLSDKEDAQVAVLEEYAGGVETIGEDEIRRTVNKVMEGIKGEGAHVDMGGILKKVIGPGGVLDGKPVERAEVARIVKETLSETKS
ncbi:MAG: hypothetical protein M1827_004021 [Pycnora praestabilis]|nr:MAG: hypothetical protein M1827_004021 [Pycnora praestabilis]